MIKFIKNVVKKTIKNGRKKSGGMDGLKAILRFAYSNQKWCERNIKLIKKCRES